MFNLEKENRNQKIQENEEEQDLNFMIYFDGYER